MNVTITHARYYIHNVIILLEIILVIAFQGLMEQDTRDVTVLLLLLLFFSI